MRHKWNQGGSVLGLELWRRRSCCQRMSLRQRMRERNTLTYPCSPCQYLTSAYHWLNPGRSQLTYGPGKDNLQGSVPLRSIEGQGKGKEWTGGQTSLRLEHAWIILYLQPQWLHLVLGQTMTNQLQTQVLAGMGSGVNHYLILSPAT